MISRLRNFHQIMNAAICKCEPRLAKSKRILETSDSYHITSFHFGSTSVQDFYFHLRFQRCKYVFGFISLNETPNYPFHGYFHSYSSGDFFFLPLPWFSKNFNAHSRSHTPCGNVFMILHR